MQCISSFNKNSPLLTFNICIYSRLRLNSITVFSSTSTRFGISTQRDSSGCVELPQRLQLEINCLKGKKQRRSNEFELGRTGVFLRWKDFCCCCCSLRLTFKCNILFGLVCTENTRKRLKASKNDWIQACMLFWTLPIQFPLVTNWNFRFTFSSCNCNKYFFYNWSMKIMTQSNATLRVFFLRIVFHLYFSFVLKKSRQSDRDER